MTIEDPTRRALAARLALRLCATSAFIFIGAEGFQIVVVAEQGVDPYNFTIDDVVIAAGAAVYFLSLVTAVVCFIRWEYRVARNAKRLGTPAFSPWWAVGWWFVPVANLVMPRRVMAELWRASAPDGSSGPVYLGAWWGIGVGGFLLGRLAGGVSASATTASVLQLADVVDIVSNALLIVATLLAMKLVGDLTRRQLAAHQRLATSSSSESTSLGPGRLK